MALSFTVGGTRGTFDDRFATEVADVLENTFGAEGDWEGVPPRHFGELAGNGWSRMQHRAVAQLGEDALPNLLALDGRGRGVYLPAYVNAIALPMSQDGLLCCASLPGLREELEALADNWKVSLDDDGLRAVLAVYRDSIENFVGDVPEVYSFALSPSPRTKPSAAIARSGSSATSEGRAGLGSFGK